MNDPRPPYYASDNKGADGWEIRRRKTRAVVATRETRKEARELADIMNERAALPIS